MTSVELGDSDVWDDSVLIDSWDGALREYKKYHSIYARGENVEEVLEEFEKSKAMSKQGVTQNGDSSEHKTETPTTAGATSSACEAMESSKANEEDQILDHPYVEAKPASAHQASADRSSRPNLHWPAPNPSGLPGFGNDEALKNLMMSWYYAGYYTGLQEGQSAAGRHNVDS